MAEDGTAGPPGRQAQVLTVQPCRRVAQVLVGVGRIVGRHDGEQQTHVEACRFGLVRQQGAVVGDGGAGGGEPVGEGGQGAADARSAGHQGVGLEDEDTVAREIVMARERQGQLVRDAEGGWVRSGQDLQMSARSPALRARGPGTVRSRSWASGGAGGGVWPREGRSPKEALWA
nr:hypothetical protein [Streptomyces antimycoticus]